MPLLMKNTLIAAAIETTAGTAETLANGDAAYNAYDISWNLGLSVETREAQGGMGKLPGVPGVTPVTISFKTDMGYDGSATEQDWAAVLLPGCGWVESSNTYNPSSEPPGSNVKTLTIGCYYNGKRFLAAGCVGTFKVVCPTGKMTYMEWTFQGVFQSDADASILTPTYPAPSERLVYKSATTVFNSVNLCVSNLTFDAGNEIYLLECGNNAAGLKHGIIVDRNPTATADPESVLVATDDRYGDWIAGTEAELSVTLDGPSTSTLEISAPKAQITSLGQGDRSKVYVDNLTWSCNKNGATADQEIQFIFTPTA